MQRTSDDEQVRRTLHRILRAVTVLVAAGFAAAVGEDLWALMKELVDTFF
jgi:hypothetical protein